MDNIKKSLKLAKNKHARSIILGKYMKKLQREFRTFSELNNGKKSFEIWNDIRETHKLKRENATT